MNNKSKKFLKLIESIVDKKLREDFYWDKKDNNKNDEGYLEDLASGYDLPVKAVKDIAKRVPKSKLTNALEKIIKDRDENPHKYDTDYWDPEIEEGFQESDGKDKKYSLNVGYYNKSFDSIQELIDDVLESGMDPNYEVTINGKPQKGETLADYITH